jgi:hypothetical protein
VLGMKLIKFRLKNELNISVEKSEQG